MKQHLEAVLRSYSIIFFSESKWVGLVLLLTTFLAPVYGLFGLLGLLVALAAAHFLEFDPDVTRTGSYTFNSLLTCIALAYLSHFQWDLSWRDGLQLEWIHVLRMLTLIVCFSLVAFFATLVMSKLLKVYLGLPAMSLPFVLSAALLYFLFYSFTRTPIASVEPDFLFSIPVKFPAILQTFLESFGAIFFLPNALAGTIILGCLLYTSRLMVIYGGAAFLAGIGFLALFGYEVTSANLAWIGFNFLFSGMVLGGIFFIPGRASIPVAMVSAFLCAALAIAFRSLFWNFNIPPLALPFNLVVLSIVYALNQRPKATWLLANPFPDGNPETNFWRFHSQQARFPDSSEPSIHLPFTGARLITQGFDGDITHIGDYRHAFDFEKVNDQRKKFSGPGDSLADFYTFNSEVISPDSGIVIRVVDHVKDNPIGRNNLIENWGNLVVIQLDKGYCLQLSHFKHLAISVTEGERVTKGTLLGYCGNSGRSPIPHLHFQLQNIPVIGATTIPFGLRNYITEKDDEKIFQFHNVPEQDEIIEAFEPDPVIASAFSDLSGTYHYQFSDGSFESITCQIDPRGNYIFVSDNNSQLTCRVIDDVFHCLEFRGSERSILALMRLVLGRVPFSTSSNLTWQDQTSIRPFLTPVARTSLEVTAPFTGYVALKTTTSFKSISPDALSLTTVVSNPIGAAPKNLVLTMIRGQGITNITADDLGICIMSKK